MADKTTRLLNQLTNGGVYSDNNPALLAVVRANLRKQNKYRYPRFKESKPDPNRPATVNDRNLVLKDA